MTRNLKLTTLSAAIGLAAAASAPLAQTAAPVVSPTGTGKALIVPYYTVRDGWMTTLNVMNTTNDTLAVKIRFREHKNSRDVLDFTIVMSPKDAWTGYLQDSPDGPLLRSNDNSCTSPLADAVGNTLADGWTTSDIAYTGRFEDFGGDGLGRMRQGYVEILVMGKGKPNETPVTATSYVNGTAAAAKHVNGEPVNCAAVDLAFAPTVQYVDDGSLPTDTDDGSTGNGLAGSGQPPAVDDFVALEPDDNPLKVNVSWLQLGTGAGAGTTALPISGWYDTTELLLTAQDYPWFLEPTLATGDALWTVDKAALDLIEGALSAEVTMNEWANNTGEGGTGAQTDMVLTFPTKAFHVDWFNDQIQAAVSQFRNDGVPVFVSPDACAASRTALNCVPDSTSGPVELPQAPNPFEALFGLNAAVGEGDSPITIRYDVCDREETCTTYTAGTSVSPAPPAPVEQIRFEANVIQFGADSALASPTAAQIDASGLLDGAKNGWMELSFPNAEDLAGTPIGLPVLGFVIKVRDQGETGSNYGQAMDNAYVRPQAER